jgi:hypothetical protein
LGDKRRVLQLARDVDAGCACLRTLGARLRRDADDQLLVTLTERVGEHGRSLRRLRRRVLEAACGQAFGDRDAEDRGADQHQQRQPDDAPGRGDSQSGDSGQHDASFRQAAYQR